MGNQAERSGSTPALQAPAGVDPRWREKRETAIRAREQAAQVRRGKPSSFRAGVGRIVP
jgi:hypothetical protein